MKKILIITLVLLLLVIAGSMFSAFALTGNAVDDFDEIGTFDPSTIKFDYSWTTAICDENKCRDFLVTCLDGEAIHVDPVSGMVVFPDDWEDRREESDSLCGD